MLHLVDPARRRYPIHAFWRNPSSCARGRICGFLQIHPLSRKSEADQTVIPSNRSPASCARGRFHVQLFAQPSVASGRSASWKRGRLDNHLVHHPVLEAAIIFARLSEAIRHRCVSWERGGPNNHSVRHPLIPEVASIQSGLSSGIRRRSALWKPCCAHIHPASSCARGRKHPVRVPQSHLSSAGMKEMRLTSESSCYSSCSWRSGCFVNLGEQVSRDCFAAEANDGSEADCKILLSTILFQEVAAPCESCLTASPAPCVPERMDEMRVIAHSSC